MSFIERMAQSRRFADHCEGRSEDRIAAKKRMKAFNKTTPDQIDERIKWITQIFGRETNVWIEPPFYFCYGTNIELGEHCYLNMNCNFVDDEKIRIGQKVVFGPNVTIATAGHPIHSDDREYWYANPVHIDDNCWIGAGVMICPGVTIGKNSVIGAESVVTRDIPANVIAAGNPCRVLGLVGARDLIHSELGLYL